MLKRSLVAGVVLLFVGVVPVNAQTSSCIRFPFQAASQTDITIANTGTGHGSVSIQLAASLVEIEQVTLRLRTLTNNAQFMSGARIGTRLLSQVVTHGIDIPSNNNQSVYATLDKDAAMSREVKFYADPTSSLTFDVDTNGGPGDTSRVFVTVVGRLVSIGCWLGPQ